MHTTALKELKLLAPWAVEHWNDPRFGQGFKVARWVDGIQYSLHDPQDKVIFFRRSEEANLAAIGSNAVAIPERAAPPAGEMPGLPDHMLRFTSIAGREGEPYYTATQMRAYGQECARKAGAGVATAGAVPDPTPPDVRPDTVMAKPMPINALWDAIGVYCEAVIDDELAVCGIGDKVDPRMRIGAAKRLIDLIGDRTDHDSPVLPSNRLHKDAHLSPAVTQPVADERALAISYRECFDKHHPEVIAKLVNDQQAEINQLRAALKTAAPALEADVKDAERYREFFNAGLPICFLGKDYHSKTELDVAIDVARAALFQPAEGGKS
ncbi:hypothetical protein [Herbaspirillum sp. YR522]|uniref:hypothetical protein n=1 Tax=Herbaspirillum sp. YR522 TaxID=1144342 RepID=UPI00026FA289|nr:hypothetical protein [Herbaspirillum sp. YR522]EJN06443.1 hypothetical protein PMI40_02229 [Herbaspirillum sp. YR522]